MGQATLRERVVPLNCRIQKFGEFAIIGSDRFDLKDVRVGNSSVPFSPVKDFFAPEQFEQLSNAEKLSRESFEQLDAGITIDTDRVTFGDTASARISDLAFRTTIIDAPSAPARPIAWPGLSRDVQIALSQEGAVATSPLRRTGSLKYADPTRRRIVTLDEDNYGIASTVDTGLRLEFGTGLSKTIAYQILNKHLQEHPEDRGALQVVPLTELAAVP
jgi:hypothetical protein